MKNSKHIAVLAIKLLTASINKITDSGSHRVSETYPMRDSTTDLLCHHNVLLPIKNLHSLFLQLIRSCKNRR